MFISPDFEGRIFELKSVNSRVEFQGTPTPNTNSRSDRVKRGCIASTDGEVFRRNCSFIFVLVLATRYSRVEHQCSSPSLTWSEQGGPNKQECTLCPKLAPLAARSGQEDFEGRPKRRFGNRSGYQEEKRRKRLPLPPSQMYQVETGCILTRRPTAVWRCSRRPNSRVFHILFRRLSIRECSE